MNTAQTQTKTEGNSIVEWPKYTERRRWQIPNGKTYSSSSQAVEAMRKLAAAKARDRS